MTNSPLYVQDVQLKPIQPPSCVLTVPSTGLKDAVITAANPASDEYQWNTYGTTHYHKRTWYGTSIFPEIDIQSIEYDFGSGFSTTNTHTYTTVGDYTVYSCVTNLNGQTTTCSKPIRIKYNSPGGGRFRIYPPAHSLLNDIVTVTATIQDVDNRITSIEHIWKNVSEAVNTNKTFSYTKPLPVF